MLKMGLHATALLALVAVICVGVTASSTHARAAHASSAPQGCTVLYDQTTDTVEQCGPCVVLIPPTAAWMATTLQELGEATPGGAWFAVGSTWIATDRTASFSGAEKCQSLYGGYLGRYS